MSDSPTGESFDLYRAGSVPFPSHVAPGEVSAYAERMTVSAENYIENLALITSTLTPPTITPVFPTPDAAPAPATASQPSMQTVVWTAPALPVAFSGSLQIADLMPAPFDDEPPLLAFPVAPSAFSSPAPDAPGVNLQFDYPDLEVNLPAPPALFSLQTYAFAGVTLPDAPSSEVPLLTVAAPTVTLYTPGDSYTSALLTSVQTSLADRINNGGTGLSAAVETAIWDRGREREYRQQRDSLLELERMESLGFAFPPGVYLDARLKIITETNYTIAGVSREIMIKQAELELQNVLEALKTATQLEGQLLTYTNMVEQRLFESAKFATEAGIEIYNAQVRAYAAYLDAYKMKVTIYEAQVRGQMALVEVYRAEIAAEEAKAQINTALVNQYRIQADVALSAVEIYKAQIGVIQTRAEVEKIKVQTFGEQVRAYTAQIGAYTAGVEGYRASIQAEGVKQEAFKSSVQAYAAQVDAAAKQAEARIEEFKGLLSAKTQEWEAYKSAYQGEAARAQAINASNSTAAETYRATVQGLSAYNDVLTKQWQVALDQAERVAEVGLSAAKSNAELYMTTRSLALDAAKVGAQVSAQLGAASLNAVSWSQSYSTGNSYSASSSNAFSRQYTYSESA